MTSSSKDYRGTKGIYHNAVTVEGFDDDGNKFVIVALPADLARSILWGYLGHEPPPKELYMTFKWGRGVWAIASGDIAAWISKFIHDEGADEK